MAALYVTYSVLIVWLSLAYYHFSESWVCLVFGVNASEKRRNVEVFDCIVGRAIRAVLFIRHSRHCA